MSINMIVCKNGKWGIINNKGEVIIPFEFQYIYEIEDYENHRSFYACQKDNSTDLRNNLNEIVIERGKYDKYASRIYDGRLIAYKKGAFKRKRINATLIDIKTGNEIVGLNKYRDLHYIDNKYYFAYDNKFNGIMIDKDGSEIINNFDGKTISMIGNDKFEHAEYDYWAFVLDDDCYDVWFNIVDGKVEYIIEKYEYDEEEEEYE